MGCQNGRIIIENNNGIIIFGNIGAININTTSVATEGNDRSSRETSFADNQESSQNIANDTDSAVLMPRNSRRKRSKKR
jgi:hypothetical protein